MPRFYSEKPYFGKNFLAVRPTLFFLFFPLLIAAQERVDLRDFDLFGDATASELCIELTPDDQWRSGSAWFRTPIDLTQNFDLQLRVFLGCRDFHGADGIVFVFHPTRRALGRAGEGMGFQGLVPSLGIELDTYENWNLGDPSFDHMAVLANGHISHDHDRGLTAPTRLSTNDYNIEDCREHEFRITWDATLKKLHIYFDGNLREQLDIDMVADIFDGLPQVFWGITSATGGERNVHRVCFEKLVFNQPLLPPARFDFATEHRIFRKDMVELEAEMFLPGTAELTEAGRRELEKTVHLLRDNPKLNLQFYVHTRTKESSLSQQRAEALRTVLLDAGISGKLLRFAPYAGLYPDENGRLRDRVVIRHTEPIP